MSTIVVPATANPGQTVTVDGSGFTPKTKFALSTVDAIGLEVGVSSNTNRPRPDGTFRVGINVPTREGPSKVRAYQGGVVVAEAPVLVAVATTPPTPPPTPVPTTPTVTNEYTGNGAGLQAFLNGVPNGAVVGLVANTIYDIGAGQLHLVSRSLTIVGRGATIKRTTRGTTPIVLLDGGGGPYALDGVNVRGSNPTPGKWDRTYEHEHGFALGGVAGFDANSCNVTNVGGDGLYLGGGNNRWASGVRFHHSTFDGIGRMGVAFTDGISDCVIDYNTFRNIGYYTFDIEPNGVQVGGRLAGAERVKIRNNTVGPKPYGDYPADSTQACGYAFATTNASGGGYINDIEVTANSMVVGSPPFRYGLFGGGTLVNVHDNPGQTTSGPC